MQRNMRNLLFWGVCIPTRVFLASRGNDPVVRAGAGVVSYRWLTGSVSNHIGFFGGHVWWADERPIHGILWGLYAATGDSRFLWTNTAFGALNWVFH